MPIQGFNVTREVASRLIGKSLRTIDRYLKSGKIRFIKIEGRTWLSREDVLSLAKKESYIEDIDVDLSPSVSSDSHSSVDLNTNKLPVKAAEVGFLQQKNADLLLQLSKNKNLLNLALKKIKILKSDLSDSVSLKDHKTKVELYKENQKKYQNYIKKMDFYYKNQQKKYISQISTVNHRLDSEKLNKMVIAFILGLILIIQPFIFIFFK
ncbi:hypothetical protein HOJ01_01655 [bacterium]|jgi:hypothetical protein|nr:hypothetical protein [bacterium]MBT6293493.1 hypothetical protein [bacterium]